MRQLVPALDKPSFPRKRESTAPDALLLRSETIYRITYDMLLQKLPARPSERSSSSARRIQPTTLQG